MCYMMDLKLSFWNNYRCLGPIIQQHILCIISVSVNVYACVSTSRLICCACFPLLVQEDELGLPAVPHTSIRI